MRQYTVKKLATLAGVSIKTLHHYDKIGLLQPSVRTENNYRLYGELELLRLQHILFYRELYFPLKEITEILDDPNFDRQKALKAQKEALLSKRARIGILVKTIDNTLLNLKTRKMMTAKELYEGFLKGKEYRMDAQRKWKKEVEQSEVYLQKKSKSEFERLKNDFEACTEKLTKMREKAPTSETVQVAIQEHYQFIREFWGTVNESDSQSEAYASLGELYVSDGRYTKINGAPSPDFAIFMRDAMKYFAETQLK